MHNWVPVNMKRKLYKTMVRLAMMYVKETVPMISRLETKLNTAETSMLWWSLVSKRDMIRSERVTSMIRVGRRVVVLGLSGPGEREIKHDIVRRVKEHDYDERVKTSCTIDTVGEESFAVAISECSSWKMKKTIVFFKSKTNPMLWIHSQMSGRPKTHVPQCLITDICLKIWLLIQYYLLYENEMMA